MKNITIAANWKSFKNVTESRNWINRLSVDLASIKIPPYVRLIVAAPFTSLYALKAENDKLQLPVDIAAQNISAFGPGAYTGEINAGMLGDIASWVIIGHSERRNYFHETEKELSDKVTQAKKAGLKVIYCISSPDMTVPEQADAVAYEPLFAIGTGKSDTPQNANSVILDIKSKTGHGHVLYGGSVKPDNVGEFLKETEIDGVLIGGASLDSASFSQIIIKALEI